MGRGGQRLILGEKNLDPEEKDMSDNQVVQNHQGNDVVTSNRVESSISYVPLVDVVENGDAFIFQADLPGVRPNDLDVNFDNGVLTIDAKVQPRQEEGQVYALREYGVGRFYRQFTLRTPIDAAGVKAELKDGELTVTAPKADSAKPRRIEIK
jgi:HSP20 family protein